MFIRLVLGLLLIGENAFGAAQMNGFTLEQFGDFTKKWSLVTVRYREDTKELRFVYANDLAYAALKGGTKYPEGAAFAKIGLITKEDGAFPSSMVPHDAKRYQFMVRGEKKFADTGGWGYALFDAHGNLFRGEEKAQAKACAACHALVPQRQFVFSQLAPLDPGSAVKNAAAERSNLTFKTVPVTALAKEDQEKIPKNFKSVRQVMGEITNEPFMGTIDEIRPALVKEAHASRVPAVFISKKEHYLVLVTPDGQTGEKCPSSAAPVDKFTFAVSSKFGLCIDNHKARSMPVD